jgi:hypothetical protein
LWTQLTRSKYTYLDPWGKDVLMPQHYVSLYHTK